MNKVFNSNQSQVSKKSKAKFRENSREYIGGIPNPRAIYIIDKDNKISDDKIAFLKVVSIVIKLGMNILGVNTPEKM